MTPEQFCYWLQGCYEISGGAALTDKQQEMVNAHLQTVFKRITQGATYAVTDGGSTATLSRLTSDARVC